MTSELYLTQRIFEPAEKETNKKCVWKEERERERGGGVWSNLCNNAQREKQQNNCYTLLLTNVRGKGKRGRQVREEQDADCSELSREKEGGGLIFTTMLKEK